MYFSIQLIGTIKFILNQMHKVNILKMNDLECLDILRYLTFIEGDGPQCLDSLKEN